MVGRVRFCIELDLDSEPIGGHLLAGEYTRSFHGWLDLATSIEALRARAAELDGTRPEPAAATNEPPAQVAELADRRAELTDRREASRAWRSRF